MIRKIIFGFVIFFLPCTISAKVIWLDQLDVKTMFQDLGDAQVNKSILGTPLQVVGTKYKRGISTHSVSHYLVNLNGKAKSISGWVGADNRNDYAGTLEFKLIADKEIIWQSGIMGKGMAAKAFNVDLKNIQKQALMVNDELKNICQIEHSRHRSFENFRTNLFSGLIAYSFSQRSLPKLLISLIEMLSLIKIRSNSS